MPDNSFEITACADGCGRQLAVTRQQINLYGTDGWYLTEHAKRAADKTASEYTPPQEGAPQMANQPNQPRQAEMPQQQPRKEGEQQDTNKEQQNPGQQAPAQPQKQ
jgi:hypothetical protein